MPRNAAAEAERFLGLLSAGRLPEDLSFGDFLLEFIQTDRGPYSFAGRKPFVEIAATVANHPWCVLSKGEQIGASTLGLGLACYHALRSGRRAGYFLPTKDFAKEFGATRLDPMIEGSELLAGAIGETDNREIKRMGDGFIYLRGLDNLKGAISVPLDLNLYDEVDFLKEKSRIWAEGRISASDLALQFYFARGEFPGSGIDALYDDSDRRKWMVRCPGCRHEFALEDSFPECVARAWGAWTRVCPKCGKAVDVEGDGSWVPEKPSLSRERIGWRLSQLAVAALPLDLIMQKWDRAQRSASKLANFKGSALAKPDAGDLQPVTDEVLAKMRTGAYAMSKQPPLGGAVFGGADCGNRVHAVWGCLTPEDDLEIFYYEVLDSDICVTRLGERMRELGCSGFAIDSKPLLTDARKLYYAHPDRVLLQEFGGDEDDVLDREHQGKPYRVLRVGRDLSLADTCDRMKSGNIFLPADDGDPIHREMDDHLKNLKKEKVQTPRGLEYHFRADLPNHFGMAVNNLRLAAEHFSGRGRSFVGVMPAGADVMGKER